jgi:hypothetical protein
VTTALGPQGHNQGDQAPIDDSVRPRSKTPYPRRYAARGIGAGSTAAVVTYGAMSREALPGPAAIIVLVVICVAVPVSPYLSPRLAVGGVLFLGWTPLSWFWAWPAHLDHGAGIVACAVGGLVGWTCAGVQVSERFKTLRPRVQSADWLPLAAGLAAILALGRWIGSDTPQRALNVLLPGFDNSPHVSMFVLLRQNGAMLGSGDATPDGSAWSFGNYPSGFHAVAATVADLLDNDPRPGPGQVLAYTHAVSIVVVISLMALTAALCSVPVLRRCPLALVPATVFLACAFMVGPGATALADGFAPFWFATSLVGIALLLFAYDPARSTLLHVAVLGGAGVGVANSWAPLVLLLAPITVPVLWGSMKVSSQLGRTALRRWSALGLIALATAVGMGRPVLMLFVTVSPGDVVEASGGFSPPAPLPLLFVVGLTVICFWGTGTDRHRAQPGPLEPWGRPLALVPILGCLAGVALLGAQLATLGTVAYYFFKYVAGLELILVAVLSLVGAVRIAAIRSPRMRHAACWGLVPFLVLFAIGLQPTRDPGAVALVSESRAGTSNIGAATERASVAAQVIAAAREATRGKELTNLVAVPVKPQHGFLAQSWLLALTGTWTTDRDRASRVLVRPIKTTDDAVRVIKSILGKSSTGTVLVPPSALNGVRKGLKNPRLEERVHSWE